MFSGPYNDSSLLSSNLTSSREQECLISVVVLVALLLEWRRFYRLVKSSASNSTQGLCAWPDAWQRTGVSPMWKSEFLRQQTPFHQTLDVSTT